jgi:hypothetical protein
MPVESGAARSEDSRPDAHAGRAFPDRDLEISAHSHRELAGHDAGGLEPARTVAQPPEVPPRDVGGRVRRRNRHQATQAKPWKILHLPGERFELGFGDPAAAGVASLINLQEDVQRRRVMRTLLIQACSNLQSIDRVHPAEALGDGAGLVRLNTAYEVPLDGESGESVHLVERLLHVALAEMALSGAKRSFNYVGRLLLTDSNYCDGVVSASGADQCVHHPFANIGEMVRDFSHALTFDAGYTMRVVPVGLVFAWFL